MARQLELNNSANWQLIWQKSVKAASGAAPYLRKFIPNQEVPFLLESHILAVDVSNPQAKLTWHSAGFLNQKIFSGQVVGGSPDAGIFKQKLYLDYINLLVLPRYSSTYSIFFEVPYWFTEVGIIVWQYIGSDVDTTEELINTTRSELDNVAVAVESMGRDVRELLNRQG